MFNWLCTYKHRIAVVWMMAAALPASGQPPTGIDWPEGQVLPHLAEPAESLDAIAVQSLSRDEQLAFAALQGQVNKRRPRIWLVNQRSEEGRDTWLNTLGLNIGTMYDRHNKHRLVDKYAGELRGVVLYDAQENPHMRNLASTVAGLQEALPVTPRIHAWLAEHGIELAVLADLTTLDLPTAMDVYEHLYLEYWPQCEKRFIVSARPHRRGGDYHHTRDLAAACGAAVVWLDCRDPAERELFGKFLSDMPAGNSVVLGWYTTERSGVTTATEYGIGTMPADHFMNATVFAGGDHTIHVPAVPGKPPLENKLYVTIFMSDGDNIQYTQHALRRIWDRSADERGTMPLNWTIAPGLVDIAPGILNYYYSTATENDCFACGPSGMGYAMPFNTLEEPGAPVGSMLDDPARMEAYARLTNTYLERSGLEVVTIWDNATGMQRAAYERFCPVLVGATVQNFRDVPSVESSLEGDRLRFERLVIPYAGSDEQLLRSLRRQLRRGDEDAPRFAAYQADIWSELQPERLYELMQQVEQQYPQVKFVRADHYFALQDEGRANGSSAEGE